MKKECFFWNFLFNTISNSTKQTFFFFIEHKGLKQLEILYIDDKESFHLWMQL